MRWGVALCSCNATLPVDSEAVRRALDLDTVPECFDCLPHDQRQGFMDWMGRERPDRVVVGCCAPAELVREAAGAGGVPPTAVDVLNLREGCFWVHPDQATANAKAARLLRAAMRTVPTAPPASGIPVKVGTTVLIAGDSPAGVALARRLGTLARPLLILDERRVVKVDGALGAFRVTVQRPIDEREVITAGQVVLISGDGDGATDRRPARTGYHRVAEPSAAELDALSLRILGLIGDFQKPAYVRYDPYTCAGGASGHQACGRCVTACPYDAVTRNPDEPLRVVVDHAACEGCGSCVAVCPTSSLTFTDPPTALLDARLRALLAPMPGAPSAPLVVAYHCPEQGAAAFEDAGRARRPYPPTVLPVPMACLRHVSDADLLTAFRYGAAGVGLIGCEACPHGERQVLLDRLAVVRTVLDAFGLGGDRIHVIAGAPIEAMAALERFTAALPPSPVRWEGDGVVPARGREAIAEAIRTLIAITGREPGDTAVPAGAPFAVPDVRVGGCTMCRACVNV
ncbi:MAG: hydrogenase iron-sulfur subunit, partial [Candidatus Rokuibacteriota bacterium]